MNTNFDAFTPEKVEKYMKRSLAFGMFPGFFSPDASTGHYFSRPELYDRARPLFRKYLPLCTLIAEAGWCPVPRVRTSHSSVMVERFGENYLTVFNEGKESCEVLLTREGEAPKSCRELLGGAIVSRRSRLYVGTA